MKKIALMLVSSVSLLAMSAQPVLATPTNSLAGPAANGPAYAAKDTRSWQAVPAAGKTATTAKFDYTQAIRERITLTADRDNDQNGKPDTYVLDIVRPKTDQPVPVVLMETPYSGWNMDRHVKVRDAEGVVVGMPNYYDNFLVPFGYAYASLDVPGTGASTGCSDFYGPADVGAAQLALDYLAGAIEGKDQKNHTVKASWSNKAVGMVGKSSGGFSTYGAASTTHPALKTIVAQSGVANTFTYHHPGGIVVADEVNGMSPGNIPFHRECNSYNSILARAASTDFSDFWKVRDHSPKQGWKIPTLVSVGSRDNNVQTAQSIRDWDNLGKAGAYRQLWVNAYGHDEAFDAERTAWLDKLHRWMDHFLLGIDNGVEKDKPVHIQSEAGTSNEYASWPPKTTASQWSWTTKTLKKTAGSISQTALSSRGSSLDVVSDPLKEALPVNSSVKVSFPVRTSQGSAALHVAVGLQGDGNHLSPEWGGKILVAGSGEDCIGGSTDKDSGCFGRLTPKTARSNSDEFVFSEFDASKTDPNQKTSTISGWKTVTVVLPPTDSVVPAGQRLLLRIAPAKSGPSNQDFEIGGGTLTLGG